MHKSRPRTVVIDCHTQNLDTAAAFSTRTLGRQAGQRLDPAHADFAEPATSWPQA